MTLPKIYQLKKGILNSQWNESFDDGPIKIKDLKTLIKENPNIKAVVIIIAIFFCIACDNWSYFVNLRFDRRDTCFFDLNKYEYYEFYKTFLYYNKTSTSSH